LHVRLVEVTNNPDLAEVAPKLPAGRLHASGGGLVPCIKGPLYLDLIAANLPDVDPPASPDPTPQEIPGSWDEIGPGHVVIGGTPLSSSGPVTWSRFGTATTRIARA
jgi:hypothetical protein